MYFLEWWGGKISKEHATFCQELFIVDLRFFGNKLRVTKIG